MLPQPHTTNVANHLKRTYRQHETDFIDFTIRTDLINGASLQLEYEVKLSQSIHGVILTRFNYGIKNVLTNDLMNNSSAKEWKNYNVMVGFGLKL